MNWRSTVGELHNPEDSEVEEMNMHLARFFSVRMKCKRDYELIHWKVSKLPSVHIIVITNVDIHAMVSTIENYENRTVTPIYVSNNSVQSTVTNNNSVQQTVIDLAPMMLISRITLFPYSNIQGNLTIDIYSTNDKNWNSD
jgi:hypothetical protein